MPKDLGNLPTGTSTYGVWEYVTYVDTLIYSSWIQTAAMNNMGLCGGLIITAAATKAIFLPFQLYSQILAYKMKLLAPDQEDSMAIIKKYNQQGNREAAKIEQQKLKAQRRSNGIYPMIGLFNLFQMPIHLVYISMINRLAYNFDINPAILTDGMLWFKDLSAPDPLGILPVVGGCISLLNVLSVGGAVSNSNARKFTKFMRVLPLISVPIWMTFPVAFNVYWIVHSGMQLMIVNAVRSDRFRKYLGLKDYLPGSKLERLNKKVSKDVVKPTIYTSAGPTK